MGVYRYKRDSIIKNAVKPTVEWKWNLNIKEHQLMPIWHGYCWLHGNNKQNEVDGWMNGKNYLSVTCFKSRLVQSWVDYEIGCITSLMSSSASIYHDQRHVLPLFQTFFTSLSTLYLDLMIHLSGCSKHCDNHQIDTRWKKQARHLEFRC